MQPRVLYCMAENVEMDIVWTWRHCTHSFRSYESAIGHLIVTDFATKILWYRLYKHNATAKKCYVSLDCLHNSIPNNHHHHHLRHRRYRSSVFTLIFKLIFYPPLTSDPMPNWTAALQRGVNYVEISVAVYLICLCKMFYKAIGILLSITARRALTLKMLAPTTVGARINP